MTIRYIYQFDGYRLRIHQVTNDSGKRFLVSGSHAVQINKNRVVPAGQVGGKTEGYFYTAEDVCAAMDNYVELKRLHLEQIKSRVAEDKQKLRNH